MNSQDVHAVCLSCQAELDPSRDFCPDCGTDNRPPEDRPRVDSHTHVYPSRRHCIVCGQGVPDVDDMGQPVNRTWEFVKSVLGFFLPRRLWWWWND